MRLRASWRGHGEKATQWYSENPDHALSDADGSVMTLERVSCDCNGVPIADVRVFGEIRTLVWFHILKHDELYQLYVSATARGTSAAAALIADAELRLRERGTATAWLSCAIGNERAATFYEKSGRRFVDTCTSRLETPEGPFHSGACRAETRERTATASALRAKDFISCIRRIPSLSDHWTVRFSDDDLRDFANRSLSGVSTHEYQDH
jgi:ribosomal protein S18 acetylase RimI-like enzyme